MLLVVNGFNMGWQPYFLEKILILEMKFIQE